MTLYELTNEYLELLDMMQDPDVDPEVLQDTMEAVGGDLEVKADSYVIVMKELQAQADKFKNEIERLTKQKTSIENNIKRMKESLLTSMQAIGKDKLPTEHFKLSIANNGGLQPLKITGDVPEEYCKLEPDNNKIREALKYEKLDFAHLEERGVSLRVR